MTSEPLTRDKVVEIVGQADDDVIAEVIATGASEKELLEAWTWLAGHDAVEEPRPHQPKGRVGRLCDILSADEPEEER